MSQRLLYPMFLSVFLFIISAAEASHGRYAHTTWERISDNQDGSVTVQFTSTQGWRDTAPDIMTINFGDGNSYHPAGGDIDDIFNGTDAGGNGYVMRRYVVEHTYSEADIQANDGKFTAIHDVCCRVTVLNGGSPSAPRFRIEIEVDLNDDNQGSVVSTAPAVLQAEIEAVNVLPIPFTEPDGEPVRCRFGTQAESEIPAVAEAGGKEIEISDECVLTWDLTDAVQGEVGDLYAVQVKLEESDRCDNGDCANTALDFLVEIVKGPLPVSSINKPVNNVLYPGVPFTIELTGVAGPDGESDFEYFFSGLPDGAEVSPPAGTIGSSPFTTTITWTPGEDDLNTSYVVLAGLLDENNLQSFVSFSMSVQQIPDPDCTEHDITSEQFLLDGGAAFQRELNFRAATRLNRFGARQNRVNHVRNRAIELYEGAWHATWQLPSEINVCTNDTICDDVSNQPQIDSYVSLITELDTLLKSNIRRLRRLGAPRRAVRRLRLRSNAQVASAMETIAEVPPTRSVCNI